MNFVTFNEAKTDLYNKNEKGPYTLIFNYDGKEEQPIKLEWTFDDPIIITQENIDQLIRSLKENDAPKKYIQRLEDLNILNNPNWIKEASRWLYEKKSLVKLKEQFLLIEYRIQIKESFLKEKIDINDNEIIKVLSWIISRSREELGINIFKGYTKDKNIKNKVCILDSFTKDLLYSGFKIDEIDQLIQQAKITLKDNNC